MKNMFAGHDILSAAQFTKEDVERIMDKATAMRRMVLKRGSSTELKGKIMTALFYEPSSRTFGSFIAAMQRLGGGFIPLQGVVYSSVAKGETLSDTVSTFASFSDVVVIRHPQVGAAKIAAGATEKPVINAGDGVGEHPTQALLDIFTIGDHFGTPDGLTITFVGDLLNGRTVHSLVTLLSLYSPTCINLVGPTMLRLPENFLTKLKTSGVIIHETEKLDDTLKGTDVLYVTRVQKERFGDLDVYEKLKNRYVVSGSTMKLLKKTAIVMHPFPRVGEIGEEVDADPRAVYIREQMKNGMFVRMALLSLLLKK